MKRKSAEEEEGKKEVCERANGSSKSNVKKMVAPADTSASTSVANDDKKFAECWRKYGLDSQPCNLHSGSNPKRTNCKDNPYCLYGLGMDKWEKVMGKLKKVTTTAGEDACKRDINKQPCGLCNLGNTCYMNSFLQLWFNDIAFRQCVFDWRPSDDFEPPSSSRMDVQVVMTALQRLFVQMQISPFEDASAQALVDSLRLDNDQQDAQEFATLFFSALEHNLASHPNGAPFRHFINTHFTGETKHKITCANCSRSSERVAKFQSLQLPIENIKSLTEALKAYFGSETLEDYRCDQCNMRGSVEQRAELTRLPPVVVIQLNRYFFDNKGKKKKFNHPVQFRRKMSFVQYAADESEAKEEAQYELCAVMVHQGTGADSGHYYDLIKEQVSGSWFKYNDEHVTVVSKAPGVDVESASPRASVAPEEQKGCYAIVYRRMSGNAIVRPRPPADIAQELTDTLHATHERETKLDSLAEELITQRSVSKYDRLSKLWKTLEVRKTNPLFARSITFLPTKMLVDIQAKELQVVVDDSKEGASNEYTKLGSKEAMEANLRDTEVYFDRQAVTLCHDGKIPVQLVRNGELKAVNRNSALLLLEPYGIFDLDALTADNICVDCLDRSEADQLFKDELEKDYAALTSLMKSKTSKEDELKEDRSDYYWLARASFNKFRKMALEQRAEDNDAHEELQTVVFEPQEPSPKKAKASANSTSVANGTNGVDRSAPATSSRNGHCARIPFNAEIKCDHGRLNPRFTKRLLVPPHIWDIVMKYFGNSVFVARADENDCQQCLNDMAMDTETAAELDKIAEEIKRSFPWLKTLAVRKWSEWTAPGRAEDERAKFALCRQFVDLLVKFIRGKSGSRSSLPHICNECVLCDLHARPMFPLGDEPDGEMCCVVPLTDVEWTELVSSDHFKNADQNGLQPIAVVGEGTAATFKDYCDECYVVEMSKRREDRYYYHNGTVNVSLKGDLTSSDLPDDAAVRRSARPRRGKDYTSVKISSNEKVIELKVRLMGFFNATPRSQLLMKSDGTVLEDEKTLQESHVASGDVVKLIIEQAVDDDDDDGRPRQLERGFKNTALAQL